MKKSLFLVLVLFFLFGSLYAQEKSVIPPSPQSQEFAKYITYDVSLYNGTPEISIPLYTIRLKGLNIPVNLSYHSSGIKLGQCNGDVGVGWVLNPGYRVSRTIYGFPDELYPMPADMIQKISELEAAANLDNDLRIVRDEYLGKFVTQLMNQFGPPTDGEYDQFVFSTPTSGGEFIITDRVNKTVTTTEYSNSKIEYINAPYESITGFKITDELGNKFMYGNYDYENPDCIENAYLLTANSAWGISNIKTVAGENVQFKYSGGSSSISQLYQSRTFSVSEADPSNCMVTTVPSEPGGEYNFQDGYHTFYNDEIITPYETLVFKHQPVPGNGIKVTNIYIESSSGDTIKTINFYYSSNIYHSFLDSIAVCGNNKKEVEIYRFDYYEKDVNRTYTFDHFGYYLPATTQPAQYFHNEFLNDPIMVSYQINQTCSVSPYCTMSDYLGGNTDCREPDHSLAPDYFSLARITYPTGGYTVYEYEPGGYVDIGKTEPVKSAGMRIKAIHSYSAENREELVKYFRYGINECGGGYLSFYTGKPEELFVNEKVDYYQLTPSARSRRVVTYSTTMLGNVEQVFSEGGLIKYPCVTEYDRYCSSGGNGKTVNYYDIGPMFCVKTLNHRTLVPYQFYPGVNYVSDYSLWNKPLLTRKVVYKYSGNRYVPVTAENFEYQKTFDTYTGLIVEEAAVMNSNTVLLQENYRSGVTGYFNYGQYNITVGKSSLKKRNEVSYFNNDSLITEYSYEYSHLLPSKESVTKSTGDKIVSYTSYPFDYDTSAVSFVRSMSRNHLLAYPVEKVSFIDNGSQKMIISGNLIKYNSENKGLPESSWSLKNSSPINSETYKFSNRMTGSVPPNGIPAQFNPDLRYLQDFLFESYDSIGNLLQVHKADNINIAYIWGYNSFYPVVKAENVDNTTLQAAINNSLPSGFDDLEALLTGSSGIGNMETPSQKQLWKTFCNNLLLQPALANKNVAIYSYSPLIGMTSVTDRNGIVTYYDYDSNGRLENVFDNDDNILKHYQYHFKNEED